MGELNLPRGVVVVLAVILWWYPLDGWLLHVVIPSLLLREVNGIVLRLELETCPLHIIRAVKSSGEWSGGTSAPARTMKPNPSGDSPNVHRLEEYPSLSSKYRPSFHLEGTGETLRRLLGALLRTRLHGIPGGLVNPDRPMAQFSYTPQLESKGSPVILT